MLNEYRCTRPSLYPAGTESSVMQGHYIQAKDEGEARATMQKAYPDELINVEYWKPSPFNYLR